jgi:hypothetical protein
LTMPLESTRMSTMRSLPIPKGMLSSKVILFGTRCWGIKDPNRLWGEWRLRDHRLTQRWNPIPKDRGLLRMWVKASTKRGLRMEAECTSELLSLRLGGIVSKRLWHQASLREFSCLDRVSGLLPPNLWVFTMLVQNSKASVCLCRLCCWLRLPLPALVMW